MRIRSSGWIWAIHQSPVGTTLSGAWPYARDSASFQSTLPVVRSQSQIASLVARAASR